MWFSGVTRVCCNWSYGEKQTNITPLTSWRKLAVPSCASIIPFYATVEIFTFRLARGKMFTVAVSLIIFPVRVRFTTFNNAARWMECEMSVVSGERKKNPQFCNGRKTKARHKKRTNQIPINTRDVIASGYTHSNGKSCEAFRPQYKLDGFRVGLFAATYLPWVGNFIRKLAGYGGDLFSAVAVIP